MEHFMRRSWGSTSRLSWAAISTPYRRTARTGLDRFGDPPLRAALPPETRFLCTPGIYARSVSRPSFDPLNGHSRTCREARLASRQPGALPIGGCGLLY